MPRMQRIYGNINFKTCIFTHILNDFYCSSWVSNTYNVPINEDLPHNENDRKIKMLKYYQWTPFILLFQAVLFYFPRMIWRSLSDKSGLDIQGLVDAIYSYHNDAAKYTDREVLMNYLTNLFNHYVKSNKHLSQTNLNKNVDFDYSGGVRRRPVLRPGEKTVSFKTDNQVDNVDDLDDDYDIRPDTDNDDTYLSDFDDMNKKHQTKPSFSRKALVVTKRIGKVICITKGKRYGNYLLALFVFVKILYTFNSVIQLFLLNHFLGNEYLLLGLEVMAKIWSGDDWTQVKRFPRVTMCDFKIREVGIVHRYSVQCVLSINLFNEKIFIFLWFWLCIVTAFNLLDLFSWSYTLIINSHERYNYVKRRLQALNTPDSKLDDKRMFKRFVNNYLREDGVLVLRLLSRNAQDLVVSEVISNLYNMYRNQTSQQRNFIRRKNVHLVNENNPANNLYSQENEVSPPPPPPTSNSILKDDPRNIKNVVNNTNVLYKQNHPYPNPN